MVGYEEEEEEIEGDLLIFYVVFYSGKFSEGLVWLIQRER